MISKKLAIEVLNASLATGADYAEIFFEDSCAKGVSLENGKVDNATPTTSTGVGLRLLKENQCIYGFTTDLTRNGLLKLANTLKISLIFLPYLLNIIFFNLIDINNAPCS